MLGGLKKRRAQSGERIWVWCSPRDIKGPFVLAGGPQLVLKQQGFSLGEKRGGLCPFFIKGENTNFLESSFEDGV